MAIWLAVKRLGDRVLAWYRAREGMIWELARIGVICEAPACPEVAGTGTMATSPTRATLLVLPVAVGAVFRND